MSLLEFCTSVKEILLNPQKQVSLAFCHAWGIVLMPPPFRGSYPDELLVHFTDGAPSLVQKVDPLTVVFTLTAANSVKWL